MFTSNSKQGISSDRSRAVAKAMIVGSFVRRSSFTIPDVRRDTVFVHCLTDRPG